MKKVKKLFFLACSLMLLLFPVSVQEYTGKNAATAAKLPTYKKVVTIKVGAFLQELTCKGNVVKGNK